MISKKFNFAIEELITKAKIKLDWHVDPLKLGSQLLLSKELKDYPHLLEPINKEVWQNFFQEEGRKLGKQILED